MSFKFNGTSVSLYGPTNGNANGTQVDSSTCSYKIDDGDPIPFTIPASKRLPLTSNDSVWANQRFFTSDLVDGDKEHEIVVTYFGPATWSKFSQPLIIDYFYVTNAARVEGKMGTKPPVGAIVGGIVGGILGLIAVAGLACFVMRKRRSSNKDSVDSTNGRLTVTPHSDMTERWTSEPLPDSRIPGIGAGEGVPVDAGLANFVNMKRAQREVVNEQAGHEQDSGIRYGTSPLSGTATRLPPIYTPE
ncbi:hypothetical protein AAF712_013058 [Marasmius tenuissimus]|uniref:Uncharacterized protein n=1 Tax=Marasmius tenuissimus TaxID=585030 RepID=A0ABR2ZGV5_9AGAR